MRLFSLLSFVCLALSWPLTAQAEPVVYKNAVFDKNVTWEGEVLVEGQAVVKKGATLTILPGTVVKFVWSDEDRNNIGDGEITCEGRFVARGTREKPILFTSASPEPKPKDWTFIMIEANKDAIMEYAVVEYAFSGFQVHFSTGEFKNNLLRNNFEGMRFSTSHILLESNDFIGNDYGIRYESRGSKTVVRKNLFKGNKVAFFPVVKCSSTVKIHDNEFTPGETAVKMGFEQYEDLDFGGNWWGTTDASAIEGMILDKRIDPKLGRVIFEPVRTSPVEGVGRR